MQGVGVSDAFLTISTIGSGIVLTILPSPSSRQSRGRSPSDGSRGTRGPVAAFTQMGDAAAKLCAFCRSPLEVERELPATAMSNKLRYFSCRSCGAGEWQAGEEAVSTDVVGRTDDGDSSK